MPSIEVAIIAGSKKRKTRNSYTTQVCNHSLCDKNSISQTMYIGCENIWLQLHQ